MWRRAKQPAIEVEIKKQKRGWIGHTLCKTNNSMTQSPAMEPHRVNVIEGDQETPGAGVSKLRCKELARSGEAGTEQNEVEKYCQWAMLLGVTGPSKQAMRNCLANHNCLQDINHSHTHTGQIIFPSHLHIGSSQFLPKVFLCKKEYSVYMPNSPPKAFKL